MGSFFLYEKIGVVIVEWWVIVLVCVLVLQCQDVVVFWCYDQCVFELGVGFFVCCNDCLVVGEQVCFGCVEVDYWFDGKDYVGL